MVVEDKIISLKIRTKKDKITDEKSKEIPATLVAKYFIGLQDMVYQIAESIEGGKFRKGGDFPEKIKKEYQLLIKDIKPGSIEAAIIVSGSQQTLAPITSISAKTISTLNDIIKTVDDEDIEAKLSDKVADSRRLDKLIRDMDSFWPEESTNYETELKFADNNPIVLNPSYKKYFQTVLDKPVESFPKTYVGRLFEIRADKNRKFQIDTTTDGTINCTYDQRILKKISGSIGSLVRVQGTLTINRRTKILHIADENTIMPLEYLTVQVVNIKDTPHMLKEPLTLNVTYENDQYIIINDELNIFVMGDTLKDAINEINYVIEALWISYVEANPEELTEGAIKFGKNLKSMFKE